MSDLIEVAKVMSAGVSAVLASQGIVRWRIKACDKKIARFHKERNDVKKQIQQYQHEERKAKKEFGEILYQVPKDDFLCDWERTRRSIKHCTDEKKRCQENAVRIQSGLNAAKRSRTRWQKFKFFCRN